jgi:hypothetical protein
LDDGQANEFQRVHRPMQQVVLNSRADRGSGLRTRTIQAPVFRDLRFGVVSFISASA